MASVGRLDDHTDDFRITKGAVCALHHADSASKPQETCSICLEVITERAVATPCNHLSFDFLCLVSWLQEQSTCPLCKAEVKEVQYDFRDLHDYKAYRVPKKELRDTASGSSQRRRFPSRRRLRPTVSHTTPLNDSLERRKRVYREQLYSSRVGANRISQYRDFTVQDFAANPELQSRTRTFLRRELQIFTFLDSSRRASNRDFLIEYVVAVLKTNELRGADGKTEELLADFLGRDNTRLLLHELEAWLRSPYTRLEDWDNRVQYAGGTDRGHKHT